jgi:hypothetical protein
MEPRLLQSLPDAPWLPQGSAAEAWASAGPGQSDPVAIVRLLLVRPGSGERAQFFCVDTDRGLDLPTRWLGGAGSQESPADGLARLLVDVVGGPVPTRCVGWIRNVVPEPDEDYALPTPYACVPVYAPTVAVAPTRSGTWVAGVEDAPEVGERHWWPVVREYLG